MTLTELQSHPIYKLCTTREKTFVCNYLVTNGDIARSIEVAYPKTKSLSAMSRKLQRNENVSALLAFIDGEENPTRAALTKVLWKAIRNSYKPSDVFKGAELLAGLEGYVGKKLPEELLREKRNSLAREIDNVTN